jgi:hypothetical protein
MAPYHSIHYPETSALSQQGIQWLTFVGIYSLLLEQFVIMHKAKKYNVIEPELSPPSSKRLLNGNCSEQCSSISKSLSLKPISII